MRIAIAIDDWKLSIFERHLTEGGFRWEKRDGISPNTLLLVVETWKTGTLATIVRAANIEARKQGKTGE